MKNLFAILMLAMLGTVVTFTSCKKDDDDDESGSGTAVVGENTATFSKGALEYYGDWSVSGSENFDLILGSSGINFANESGSGDILYFELYTDSQTFNGGTFTYSYDAAPGTFDDGFLVINGNWDTEVADHYYEVTAGTVVVSKSGSTYDINYTLTVQEYESDLYTTIGSPVPMLGEYTGPLKKFDYSYKTTVKEKISFIKK